MVSTFWPWPGLLTDPNWLQVRLNCENDFLSIVINIFYTLIGDKNGHIAIWDPDTGAQSGKLLIGHKQFITSLVWKPLHLTDGNYNLST